MTDWKLLNPTFAKIVETTYYKLPPNQKNPEGQGISPGNKLVKKNWPQYYRPDVLGGKRRIFKCRPRDERHVVGADIVFLVIQTARICKMRILAPKLGGFFIHQNSKCISGASYVLGECVGSLIG